jgi:SAM-dependent methyltransferase
MIRASSDREVLRARVVANEGRGRLLGPQLVLVAHANPDAIRPQKVQEHLLVGQVGAGRVAEGEAAAAVALLEELLHLARVLSGDVEIRPHLLVDVLGQPLRRLHGEPVQVQVVLVEVLGEPLARDFRGVLSHGDDLQGDHVGAAVLMEEVADAEPLLGEMNEKFSMIISNSTMQWFADIKTSFGHIKSLLAPGGIFLASIFGPETFKELSSAFEHLHGSPVALSTQSFHNKDQLLSMLDGTFRKAELEELIITRKYTSTFQLLRNIKKTGTTGGGSRPPLRLNRTKLKILDDWFEKNHGECTATYQLFFIKAR